MKKQIMTGVCSAVMMCAFALPVYAIEQTTTLNAEISSTYTLTIPASTGQTIAYNAEKTTLNGKLSATGNLKAGEKIQVSATINPLTDSTKKSTIPFTLYTKGTTTPFTTAQWSEADLSSTTVKEIELDVNIPSDTWKTAKAGTYTGSIVFSAELK